MLAILVVASLLNGLSLPLVGRHVRPEHVAAPIVFAALFALQGVRRRTAVRLDAFSALAIGWVAVNALSSWLYAPQPAESFVHVVRMALLVMTFLTVANLPFLGAAQWVGGFRLWLSLGLVELAYGVVTWLLARYGDIWLSGAYLEPAIAGINVAGTQMERNLFGILAGTLLSIAFYALLAQRERSRPRLASTWFLAGACALAGGAVVLSLTRSAWVAVVVGGPATYLVFDRRRLTQADRPLLQAIVALPVFLVVLIATMRMLPAPTTVRPESAAEATTAAPERQTTPSPSAHDAPATAVDNRLSTFGRLTSDFTVRTRVQDAQWALSDWRSSPVLGHGTGSFLQIHGMRAGSEAWISNLVLHTLVDTGLVGLVIQLSLFVLVVRRAWRAAGVTREPQLAIALRAMTLGFLVMATAYQLTDGTWLAVIWIHLGLMVSGIYCVERTALQPDRLTGALADSTTIRL